MMNSPKRTIILSSSLLESQMISGKHISDELITKIKKDIIGRPVYMLDKQADNLFSRKTEHNEIGFVDRIDGNSIVVQMYGDQIANVNRAMIAIRAKYHPERGIEDIINLEIGAIYDE